MSENSRYMVVITGKALPGHDIANVRNNVAVRFNMQDARVDKLFSGRPVAIKRNLELGSAKKYKEIFNQLGAECLVMVDKTSKGEPAKPAKGKKAVPPAKTKENLTREIFINRVEKQFEHLDAQYAEVGSQSGFEKINVLFSILTLVLLITIGVVWAFIPIVTWYMAVPAMILALIALGVPVMRSQKTFLKKVMAALVDEEDEDLAFSLACLDTWLDRLHNQRHAALFRKELDHVIGRHTHLMEKMMDYAYSIAQISTPEEVAEAETPPGSDEGADDESADKESAEPPPLPSSTAEA